MSPAAAPETLVCDTSIVSMLRYASARPQALAHWPEGTLDRLGSARLAISAITLAEAEYGFLKSKFTSELVASERRRLRSFGLLPIDPDVIIDWAILRDAIERSGRPRGDNDLWIAATARTRDATVVTADKHFLPLADHVDVLYLKRKPDSSDS